MEAKEIESFLHLTAEAKDSWDQMCFSKCVDTFGLKLTDQQYECLKICTTTTAKAMSLIK